MKSHERKYPLARRELPSTTSFPTRVITKDGDISTNAQTPSPRQMATRRCWSHSEMGASHDLARRRSFFPSSRTSKSKVIESGPALYVASITTFKEIPVKYKDPLGSHLSAMLRKVQDYIQLLQLFNYILTTVPKFNEPGMAGVPVNATLVAHVGTKSGNAAFLYLKVRKIFTKMLNEWARFLGSSAPRTRGLS
jgi:hypothetical protein